MKTLINRLFNSLPGLQFPVIAATAFFLIFSANSLAIVNGQRDCAVNELNTPGSGCHYPTVGVTVNIIRAPDGSPIGYSRCTARLIYNGPDKAVVLTAAHCIGNAGGPIIPSRGDGVNFDSQVVDDSVTPYKLAVINPGRVVNVDRVIVHPLSFEAIQGSISTPEWQANDIGLLIIDDPVKLNQLNSLWSLPTPTSGELVKLLPENYLDSLSTSEFKNLPLIEIGYGRDWFDGKTTGPIKAGLVGNKGFRTIANLTMTSLSTNKMITQQNQQKSLEGICLGDSGSTSFLVDSETGAVSIVGFPVAVHSGVFKCLATTTWNRLDKPNAINFISCAFVPGSGLAVQECVNQRFGVNN